MIIMPFDTFIAQQSHGMAAIPKIRKLSHTDKKKEVGYIDRVRLKTSQ